MSFLDETFLLLTVGLVANENRLLLRAGFSECARSKLVRIQPLWERADNIPLREQKSTVLWMRVLWFVFRRH